MKSDYIERAKKFVMSIDTYLEDAETLDDYYSAGTQWQRKHPRRRLSIDNGATRVVFITSDYVIKITRSDGRDEFGGCYEEYLFYNSILGSGFEYLFAEITPFFYNGRCYYIMPKINGVGKGCRPLSCYLTNEELRMVIRSQLYDLHGGNYGFKNGHVVFIDYAAYD